MEKAPWKKISEHRVYGNPFFTVNEDKVIKPDGLEGTYYTIHHHHGISVIAYKDGLVLLVSQYRYAMKKTMWSFIAGSVEGENFLENAQRELKEESGYEARQWEQLGVFPMSPAFGNHYGYTFLAKDLIEGAHMREGGEMDMQTKWSTIEDVEAFIVNGEFSSFDIAGFYLLKKYLGRLS